MILRSLLSPSPPRLQTPSSLSIPKSSSVDFFSGSSKGTDGGRTGVTGERVTGTAEKEEEEEVC